MDPIGIKSEKIFSRYDSYDSNSELPQLCSELFAQQRSSWQQMSAGYDSLEFVRHREILCSGFDVQLQINPKRIVSTGANVDPAAIRSRPCFLCTGNLPEAQKGILFRNEYLILCNPAPIFSKHFTISHIQHTPQEIEPSLNVLFDLARELCPDYSVFYNGPRCGASAPDHMHFQASPRRAIPVETDAVDSRRRKRCYYKNHVAGCTLLNYGRAVIVLESSDMDLLSEFTRSLIGAWRKILNQAEEPMMNLICSFQENIWRLIIFPRRKHRPESYWKEGDERILISPAAVDMGGLIITPLEKDFSRLDSKIVEGIYAEVTENQKVLDALLEVMG